MKKTRSLQAQSIKNEIFIKFIIIVTGFLVLRFFQEIISTCVFSPSKQLCFFGANAFSRDKPACLSVPRTQVEFVYATLRTNYKKKNKKTKRDFSGDAKNRTWKLVNDFDRLTGRFMRWRMPPFTRYINSRCSATVYNKRNSPGNVPSSGTETVPVVFYCVIVR